MGVRRTLSQQGLSGETRQRLAGLGTICPSGAIERAGRDMTIDDILDIVDQDRPFYEASGGGLTLSGGEPLANPAFSIELARQAKARQLHVCLQTSGCGSPEAVKGIVPFVDLFLWDIKDTDAARLKANTGGDLETMAANLSLADAMGAATVLACLMIPDVNMNEAHYRGIAGLYERLQHCRGVKLTPYHPFGISKYEQLGLPVPDGRFRTPGSDRMAEAKRRLEALGVKVQSD
jgi:pyruvate formate lyase activating enzyme